MFGKIIDYNFKNDNFYIKTDKGYAIYIDIPTDKKYYFGYDQLMKYREDIKGSEFLGILIKDKNFEKIEFSPFFIINPPKNVEFKSILLEIKNSSCEPERIIIFEAKHIRWEIWDRMGMGRPSEEVTRYPYPEVSLRIEKEDVRRYN